MKSIPSGTQQEMERLRSLIADLGEHVLAAITAFNAMPNDETRRALETASGAYNMALASLHRIFSDLADRAQAFFDEHSERWQESADGESYEEWMNSLAEAADALDDATLKEFAATAPIAEPELFDGELPDDKPQ
jgi:hypothetical protein